ncbi:MAG: hypothetical protein KH297_04660 [Firmicutes bacterium]|nr:hypothetical protein [Bacillota bacterium]
MQKSITIFIDTVTISEEELYGNSPGAGDEKEGINHWFKQGGGNGN